MVLPNNAHINTSLSTLQGISSGCQIVPWFDFLPAEVTVDAGSGHLREKDQVGLAGWWLLCLVLPQSIIYPLDLCEGDYLEAA